MIVERLEDMSPTGRLQLIQQDDGDVCIQVIEDDGNGEIESIACVEFCMPFTGGGQSPRTLVALKRLMKAMEEDNNDKCLNGRNPEIYFKQG
jgi:hypothetical protein